MSGVYIPGMEMPKGCASCKISRRNSKKMICPFIWKCEWDVHDPMSADHKLDGCPLLPVPPHGDLIDRDALSKRIKEETINQAEFYADRWHPVVLAYGDCYGKVQNAPTIIPADHIGGVNEMVADKEVGGE